jgi:hypothetical protein
VITSQDEELHTPGNDPEWQESFYFNWSSADARSFGLTRIGVNPASGTGDAVVVILRDGKPEVVHGSVGQRVEKDLATTPVSEGIRLGALTYTMNEPLCEWHIVLEGPKRVELTWRAFTPAHDFHASFPGDDSEPQAHFEQSGTVTGRTVINGVETVVTGLGQRDKSWGVRRWSGIAGWDWIAGQFDDGLAFNTTLTDVDGVRRPAGFVFHEGTLHTVTGVDIDYTWGAAKHQPETALIDITVEGGRTFVVRGRARGRIPLLKNGLFIEETQAGFEMEIDGVVRRGAGVIEHAFHVDGLGILTRLPRLLPVLLRARRDSK